MENIKSPRKNDGLIDWQELYKQKPREIVFSGEKISKKIEQNDGQLDEIVYRMLHLNFLEITNTTALKCLSSKIGNLQNLTNLVLHKNQLTSVPDEIGSLNKLKCLNLSYNSITTLPDSFFEKLVNLQMLNLENNLLEKLPDMRKLSSLVTFKCAANKLLEFPSSICDGIRKNKAISTTVLIFEGGAIHLAEMDLSHNQITELPYTIERLVALKMLDLSHNLLTAVPQELADCPKLKEVKLIENPFRDKKLLRIVNQQQTKRILDHVRANATPSNPKKANANGDLANNENDSCDDENDEKSKPKKTIIIRSVKNSDLVFKVLVSKLILNQRKIVACIIHDIDVSNPKLMRKFLNIQTKLHQGLCDNRQKATIATHDFQKFSPPPISYASKVSNPDEKDESKSSEIPTRAVLFDGKVPTRIKLTPLGRTEMSAMELYRVLSDEADHYRKEKKRNTIAGIHKYLHLLKGKQLFPVLMDREGKVLSLPPLTNAEYSKVNSETKTIFIEVTGENVPFCREVMNEFIHRLLELEDTSDEDGSLLTFVSSNTMIIEPCVAEIADTHELIVKYPAKIDLQFDDANIVNE